MAPQASQPFSITDPTPRHTHYLQVHTLHPTTHYTQAHTLHTNTHTTSKKTHYTRHPSSHTTPKHTHYTQVHTLQPIIWTTWNTRQLTHYTHNTQTPTLHYMPLVLSSNSGPAASRPVTMHMVHQVGGRRGPSSDRKLNWNSPALPFQWRLQPSQ